MRRAFAPWIRVASPACALRITVVAPACAFWICVVGLACARSESAANVPGGATTPAAAPGPAPASTPAIAPSVGVAPPWTIVYADGSANVSTLRHASATEPVRFEYEPVTPERSSTGTYSGGAPRKEQLAPDDPRIASVWREVERLEADTSLHTDSRNKGTGAFAVTTPAGTREFIVEQGPALHDIEHLLSTFGE